MILVQDVTSAVNESASVLFTDLFLCPMCGSIGKLGHSGFISTDRPAWFRCLSCEYTFAFERPRRVAVAENYHES